MSRLPFKVVIIRSNHYNLRNNDFIIPRVNTTGYGKHSVRCLKPVLWSKIDEKFRELKTLDEFKRVIRKVDLAKHIYLIIVLTVLFVIFVGGIIKELHRDYRGTVNF